MTDEARRALFGLRTSVAYFASPTGFAKLDIRMKTAALVYDELLVEGGVYECTITDAGVMDHSGPIITAEQLKPLRTRRGAVAGMRVAKTGTTDFHTIMSGHTEQRYRSQFHSRFAQIEPLKARWIHLYDLAPQDDARVADLARDWSWRERELAEVALPNRSRWFRNKVHENLNLDLAQAALIGADLLPDGLNEPLLRAKIKVGAARPIATGERPLHLLLPDIAIASWEDIAELRKDRGIKNLRAKLRELDDADREDSAIIERINAEYLAELERRQPKWRSVGTKAALTLLSAIPPIAVGSEGIGLAKEAVDTFKGRRDWIATLIRARHHLKQQRS